MGRTIHVLKDMTGQREAERRYRELFDSIQEGLFFCNLDGRILEINRALAEMLGLDRGSELRGRSLGFLVPTARRRELESALESARAGQADLESRIAVAAHRRRDTAILAEPQPHAR